MFNAHANHAYKKLILAIAFLAIIITCSAQCASHKAFFDKIVYIETDSVNETGNRLASARSLLQAYEKCGYPQDSLYARILHRIGALQISLGLYDAALQNTLRSLRINMSGRKSVNPRFAARSYYNVAWIYYALNKWEKTILYNDSMIRMSAAYPEMKGYIVMARLTSSSCYNYKSDYEKAISEATLGINMPPPVDTARIVEILIERAIAYNEQKKIAAAEADMNTAIDLLRAVDTNINNYNIWANAYSCKAKLLADRGDCNGALQHFSYALSYRQRSDAEENVPWDYYGPAYVLMSKCPNTTQALSYFNMAAQAALQLKNTTLYAIVYSNIAELSFQQHNYMKALKQIRTSLQAFIPFKTLPDELSNYDHKSLLTVDEKGELQITLNRKFKYLLYLYKTTNDKKYLTASLNTARLNDSLISSLRHEETYEQSKLYWRNNTREFFERALEACYLDNNPELFFFFMEKSRAALLNDKVNELAAMNRLPESEQVALQKLVKEVAYQQQELHKLAANAPDFATHQTAFYKAHYALEAHIKSLENKYQWYYKYKYTDAVPPLKQLQQYLAGNKQGFIHYFIGDSATYIFGVTAGSTRLLRLPNQQFNKESLRAYLRFCTNKNALNLQYEQFTALSHKLYKDIFEPLQMPGGRVVVCMDNMLIPFEALCTDSTGRNFLLHNFSFNYVYSARFLLRRSAAPQAIGHYAGFAPVQFNASLGVAELSNAAKALSSSAAFYSNEKLFTHEKASKGNFFQHAPHYSVVNIFSHAWADTADDEPLLYMQDSAIRLSELQQLISPATRLVLLSACQTNVGRNATGEGIYSLARGFASAGIPAIAATLWDADEATIYAVSEKFNQYLAEGMNKDEALQKAKLDFLNANSGEKLLPYFWANLILIGDADAITLDSRRSSPVTIWIIAGIFAVGLLFLALLRKRKNAV